MSCSWIRRAPGSSPGGAGGQTLWRRGFSKDHRPDLNQMILAVLLDGGGRPVCTEMWPGNTAELEARELIYVLGVRERTDKLGRELVLDDPAPFVPFVLMKPRSEVDYEAKAVKL